MHAFIQQANDFGKQRQPFFFLIDFELKMPVIFPLDKAKEAGILFNLSGKKNCSPHLSHHKVFNFSAQQCNKQNYVKKFKLVQQNIQAGNSYLLNLTEITPIETNYSLLELYLASEAKYKLYFESQFVCFSPECFVKTQAGKIYSYPMKGTINANIEGAEQKLLNCEKEFSEHNTIVDLIRNDLALVSHNIQVTKYRYIERVETHKGAIYQTSSEICGELAENWQEQIGTMLAKLLPAGSISGAPKQKTVEIIAEAEQQTRGYYTGVFGYFDGENLDSAVAIRYIEQKGKNYYFRSGGGITILSDLEQEYNEILEKVYVPLSRF